MAKSKREELIELFNKTWLGYEFPEGIDYLASWSIAQQLVFRPEDAYDLTNAIYYGNFSGLIDENRSAVKDFVSSSDKATVIVNAMFELQGYIANAAREMSLEEAVNRGLDDKMHSLLPLELSGWREAGKYLEVLRGGLRDMGIVLTEDLKAEIKQLFDERSIQMLSRCNPDEMQFVRDENGNVYATSYSSVEEMIRRELGSDTGVGIWLNNPEIIDTMIMPELMSHGFGADEQLMEKLADLGVNIEHGDGLDDQSGLDTPGDR